MKHAIFIITSLFFLFSCQSSLSVISAKKKMIYPGIPSLKPYTKFVVTVEAKNPKQIQIDSLIFVENNQCYNMIPRLSDNKSSTLLKEIQKDGTYTIEANLKKHKYKKIKKSCKQLQNGKLTIFYKNEQTSKKIEITSFIQKKQIRR